MKSKGNIPSSACSSVAHDLCSQSEALPGLQNFQFSSVQFSRSVVSESLWLHGLQHTRPPCPSPTPRVYPNSCPLSRWCHPAIWSSVIPFSSCLQSFPESGSLPRSQFFAIGWPKYCSFSFSISPSNEYSGLIFFRIDWLDLLAIQENLKSLIQHHSSKASILRCSAFFIVQLSYPYMTTGKTIALTKQTFVGKVMFLLFNMLSQFSSVVTPGTAVRQASLSITNSWSLLNSCPLSRWCHPTISSSVIRFSSHLQSFPASGYFPMSLLFYSGGQNIGVSASASVLPMNIRDWFPLGWAGLISLKPKALSRVFSNTINWSIKASILQPSAFFTVQLSRIHTWILEKP